MLMYGVWRRHGAGPCFSVLPQHASWSQDRARSINACMKPILFAFNQHRSFAPESIKRHSNDSSKQPAGDSSQNRRLNIAQIVANTRTAEAARVTAAKQKTDSTEFCLKKEEQEYWQEVLQTIDKPSVANMVKDIVTWHPLGRAPQPKTSSRREFPCYEYIMETKKKYPRHVVLVRIGQFYESSGLDALVLVQHCGLNPMSPHSGVPRAGCPIMNMPRTVQQLNAAGFSVVVCNEVEGQGRTGEKKTRYVLGTSTPAKPLYMGYLAEDTGSIENTVLEAPPMIGIATSKRGYMFMETKLEMGHVEVTKGLSQEALMAKLNAGGVSPPVMLHNSVQKIHHLGLPLQSMLRRFVRQEFGLMQPYDAPDPVGGFIDKVKLELSLDANIKLEVVGTHDEESERPKPPYMSTITQLGLTNAPGVPNLLDWTVGPHCPALSRSWLLNLLLLPPPPHMAQHIHWACSELLRLEDPVPEMYASLSARRISEVLQSHRGNEHFFREVAAMLPPVIELLSNLKLTGLVCGVLPYTTWALRLDHDKNLDLSPEMLLKELQAAQAEVERVVQLMPMFIDEEEGEGEESLDEEAPQKGAGRGVLGRANSQDPLDIEKSLQGLITGHERFRNKVHRALIEKECAAVDSAKARIEREMRSLAPHLPSDALFKYYFKDKMIAVKCTKRGVELAKKGLHHQRDRNGLEVAERWSTDTLDRALLDYRQAAEAGMAAARRELTKLCQHLEKSLRCLVVAAYLAAMTRALYEHVEQGKRQRWCLPSLETPGRPQQQQQQEQEQERLCLDVQGVWPYWCRWDDPSTVANDIKLDKLILLTGANMAGKSTVLRCVASLALLGCCGLMVPARSARVPLYNALMLRNFSGDSPLERKSSFAMEMEDMRAVLSDASGRSLVLLDELGKGTEVLAGTALAAAMLEQLAAAGCTGIFATHLHGLAPLMQRLVDAGQVGYMCMEMAQHGVPSQLGRHGMWKPTWRMTPGVCRESLAFKAADDSGVPANVVARAVQIYEQQLQQAPPHKVSSAASRRGLPPASILTLEPDTASGSAAVARENMENIHQEHMHELGTPFSGENRLAGSSEADEDSGQVTAPVGNQQEPTHLQTTLADASEILRTAYLHLVNTVGNSSGTRGSSSSSSSSSNGSDATSSSSSSSSASSNGSDDNSSKRSSKPHSRRQHACKGSDNNGSGDNSTSTSSSQMDLQVAAEAPAVYTILPGQTPPPSHVHCSTVYVVQYETGWFYCGDSDSIKGRLKAHRTRSTQYPHRGKGVSMVYILCDRGKSFSRAVQTATIRALEDRGAPVLSVEDKRLRNFGQMNVAA